MAASLPVHGQQLFNTLPANLRNTTDCTVESFKGKLDKYLRTIPDEPQITGYTAMRRAETNSLLDMTRLANAHHELLVDVPGDIRSPIRGCANSIAVAE